MKHTHTGTPPQIWRVPLQWRRFERSNRERLLLKVDVNSKSYKQPYTTETKVYPRHHIRKTSKKQTQFIVAIGTNGGTGSEIFDHLRHHNQHIQYLHEIQFPKPQKDKSEKDDTLLNRFLQGELQSSPDCTDICRCHLDPRSKSTDSDDNLIPRSKSQSTWKNCTPETPCPSETHRLTQHPTGVSVIDTETSWGSPKLIPRSNIETKKATSVPCVGTELRPLLPHDTTKLSSLVPYQR